MENSWIGCQAAPRRLQTTCRSIFPIIGKKYYQTSSPPSQDNQMSWLEDFLRIKKC